MKVISHSISDHIRNPRNVYVVEMRTFWANDDFHSRDTLELGPFGEGIHEQNLYSLVETCERMLALPPNKVLRHECGYSDVLGFTIWFEPGLWYNRPEQYIKKYPEMVKKHGEEKINSLLNNAKDFAKEYPYAVRYDSSIPREEDTPPQLKSYEVFYYNSTGQKFKVDFIWA